MKKILLVAAAAVLVLSGCAQFQTLGPQRDVSEQDFATWCEKSIRCATVTIENGAIVVKPETVHVPSPRGRFHMVVWRIATPGYIFVNEPGNRPIVFKSANTQFDPENPHNGCWHYFDQFFPANGRIFLCVDRNTEPGPFHYRVKVTAVAPAPAVPVLDPVVFNDP